jgi:rhodanese-related sulfurtransferase
LPGIFFTEAHIVSHTFTVAQLQAALTSATPPIVLDVRRAATFERANELIADAVWHDPERVANWSGGLDPARPVVVYCVHGHQVSQDCARKLRDLGLDAAYLEGGIEAWTSTGGKTAAKTGAST